MPLDSASARKDIVAEVLSVVFRFTHEVPLLLDCHRMVGAGAPEAAAVSTTVEFGA